MITFITTSPRHKVVPTDELVITNKLLPLKEHILECIEKSLYTGFDTETTGLDALKHQLLLGMFGNYDNQYVLDNTCDDLREEFIEFMRPIADKLLLIGSNLKFDYKFAKVGWKVIFKNLWDIEIADRRLLQGFTPLNSTIRFTLVAIIARRCGQVPAEMDKDIRMEFVGTDPKTFVFQNKHVTYSAYDVKSLHKVKEVQEALIKKSNMEFLIYGIEHKLIRRLADAELEGLRINETKWKENILNNKKIKFKKECELDVEVRRLRDILPISPTDKQFLTGGKFDRDRTVKEDVQINGEAEQLTMFNIPIDNYVTPKKNKAKVKEIYKSNFINYSSYLQLTHLFARLKQELPTEYGDYFVPEFTSYRTKSGQVKHKIDNSVHKFTTGEGAIESYLIENPFSPVKEFVKLLIEYRGATTKINTFGASFLKNFINPYTGKVHTIFRQANAANGRLQSGDADEGFYNSQNIPAEKEYRTCFHTDDGHSMSTNDLSGAEVIILASKSKDYGLYKMAAIDDDTHSPIAQAAWRAVFGYRYRVLYDKATVKDANGFFVSQPPDTDEMKDLLNKSKTYIISKKENKDIRTIFKNCTFAIIYGARYKKVAKMLGISHEEAKIVIATVKKILSKPNTLVEQQVKFALTYGYLIFNTRTNSRIWYPDVYYARKNKTDIPFSIQHEVDNSARNAPISGTQADMVKEMMVEIADAFEKQGLESQLLLQVHDELVYKHPKCEDGISEEWKTNPRHIIYSDGNVKIAMSAPEFIKRKMSDIACRYLIPEIKMNAEQHVLDTWIK